jgi:hypothetical protein
VAWGKVPLDAGTVAAQLFNLHFFGLLAGLKSPSRCFRRELFFRPKL